MQRFLLTRRRMSASPSGTNHQRMLHVGAGSHAARQTGNGQFRATARSSRRQRRQARRQRTTIVVAGCCAAAVAASVAFAMTASAADGRQRRVRSRDRSVLHNAMLANSLVPRLANEGVARDPHGHATATPLSRMTSMLAATRAQADQATAAAVYAQVLNEQRAHDAVWDRLAQCETGGNWSMHGSSFSGGLGFYNSTWSAFGGHDFAPHAGLATREQQIIVATRIRARYGYTGWGCAHQIGL